MTRATTSATDASRRTASICTLGTSASAAVFSAKRIVRVNSRTSSGSSAPASPEVLMRNCNSSVDVVDDSSSRGSTPKPRTTLLAIPLNTLLTGRVTRVKTHSGYASVRAVRSANVIATLLGTTSPSTVWNTAARNSDTTTLTPLASPRTGSSTRRTDGSAMKPNNNDATVIPSCVDASDSDSWRESDTTRRAVDDPESASCSMRTRSHATSENSPATKN